ncbi:MAG: 3-oxoacyl-[acyl-carrier-protein] reductase [Chlorobi bacterium]|nr:3-oxoacyl-[acyl-carrier-protein] reductase [Chlorobiota bacterium]
MSDSTSTERLEEKVAIVTGGSRGIGAAIVRRLATEGAKILFTYNSSAESANSIVEELGSDRAMALKCDVSKEEEVEKLVEETISQWGKIHILVNNAGITRDRLVLRMSREDFEHVVQTNLTGAFLAAKNVMRPMMKERWGRIINIASVVGLVGNPGQANYVASKAGLIGMTKSMAREVASRNILVNCIAPGFIDTDMTDKLNETQKDAIQGQIPLARIGTPEEVARVIAFLASDDASYITGQVLAVDGGMTMV